MTGARLQRSTPLPAGLEGYPVDPEQVGIVHLGIGAFHRTHQAYFTELAVRATGDRHWGVLGVTQRSAAVRDQLRPQGGVYSVMTLAPQGTSLDVVGSVLDVAHPGDETGRVLAAMAAPTTHVVTLTVTEKGYSRLPDGGLDLAQVGADLEALSAEERGEEPEGTRPARSAVGLLVRGLAARRRAAAGQPRPLTVLTCDNMADNGHVLAGLVRTALDVALPGTARALHDWLDAHVAFPCSMVDRIAPVTTPAQRDAAERLLGARDEGLVVAEPFRQWVIEDRFAGPRPAWEVAGATFTAAVAPYERAKLRLLNGTHSLVAYTGLLAGHATIAEAVADPEILTWARRLVRDDAVPTLVPPDGLDLEAYGEQILARFANPHIGHTTAQVATDGTQKIPQRWGPVAAARLARGVVPQAVARGLAAWAVHVTRTVRAGGDLADPREPELRAVVDAAAHEGEDAVVRRLLTLPGLLPDGAGADERLAQAVVEHARGLRD